MSYLVDFSKLKMVQNNRIIPPGLRLEKSQVVSLPFSTMLFNGKFRCSLNNHDCFNFQNNQKALRILQVGIVSWTG